MREWVISEEDLGCDGHYLSNDEVVRCKDCKHYKRSKIDKNRKMCFRKDIDGWLVCYDFYPTDYCSYGERREDVGNC